MRQANGTDVLGSNDPRSKNLGVIYVSPSDDRKSVLAAIITQEKLGRKQVAVVLPEQNKAFQRPVDFDDLKSIRRKLQTQIVFIAPSGPGPAEFARQRRFPVYSSLENFAQALRDEEQMQSSGKRGWLFGARPKAANSSPNGASKRYQTEPLAGRGNGGNGQPVNEPQAGTSRANGQRGNGVAPFVAGAALGGAAAMAANHANQAHGNSSANSSNAPGDPHDNESFGDVEEMDDPTAAMQESDDSWEDELPPPAPSAQDVSELSTVPIQKPSPDAKGPAGDEDINIIQLRRRPRTTNKLPLAGAGTAIAGEALAEDAAASSKSPGSKQALADTPSRPVLLKSNAGKSAGDPPSRRPNGKLAAAGVAGGAAAGAVKSRPAGGAVVPPPGRTNLGNGGRGGSRGRARGWIIAALVLLAALAICGGLAYAQPNALGPLRGIVPTLASPATVTITPDSKQVQDSYIILGVTGTPNPDQRQIAARTVSGTAQSQPKTVQATGRTNTPGVRARGELTFTNGSFSNSYTVGTDTAIPAGNGLSVFLSTPAQIPVANSNTGVGGSVTVPAYVSQAGTKGNIAAFSVNETCCNASGNVFVKNTSAFAGGQDQQRYSFLQQSDVAAAVNPVRDATMRQAMDALQKQLQPGWQIVGNPQCTPTTNVNQPVGDKGQNVTSATVSFSMKCTATAYDQKGAQDVVTKLLQSKANTDPGSGYSLVGNVVTQTSVQNVNKNGNVALVVTAKGVWAYQISDAMKQDLARRIAGKTVNEARTLLKSQKGIGDASVQVNGDTLPTDAGQITIVIQQVAPAQGGGTPTAGPPTVTGGQINPGGGESTPPPGK